LLQLKGIARWRDARLDLQRHALAGVQALVEFMNEFAGHMARLWSRTA